jgi:glutathionyl-hydroquinone reductase
VRAHVLLCARRLLTLRPQFDEWAKNPGTTFYPDALRPKIDALNEWIYDGINNGTALLRFSSHYDSYDSSSFFFDCHLYLPPTRVPRILGRRDTRS